MRQAVPTTTRQAGGDDASADHRWPALGLLTSARVSNNLPPLKEVDPAECACIIFHQREND